jgi:hypothetical protein
MRLGFSGQRESNYDLRRTALPLRLSTWLGFGFAQQRQYINLAVARVVLKFGRLDKRPKLISARLSTLAANLPPMLGKWP